MTTPSNGSSGTAGKILVLDDDPLIRAAIRRALSRAYEVTLLDSGRDALALLEAGHRYDVILCDLVMPELSGVEFYEALAQRFPEQLRCMAFVTGGSLEEELRSFLEAAPLPHIDKPFDAKELRVLIERIRSASCAPATGER